MYRLTVFRSVILKVCRFKASPPAVNHRYNPLRYLPAVKYIGSILSYRLKKRSQLRIPLDIAKPVKFLPILQIQFPESFRYSHFSLNGIIIHGQSAGVTRAKSFFRIPDCGNADFF